MKRVYLGFSVALLMAAGLSACNTTGGNQGSDMLTDTTEEYVPVDGTAIDTTHNAKNSLDYAGTYVGTLPCADCEGIETTVTLKENGEYESEMTYLGKGADNVFKDSGTYTWEEDGNRITTRSLDATDQENKYFVSENMIKALDSDGNEITGSMADLYILEKR